MPINMKEQNYSADESDEIYDSSMGKLKEKGTKSSSRGISGNSRIARRRQVHVRCEHRRRKEIQDSLDALNAELPITPKPRSKGAIILDSADMIKDLTFTLDRLLNDNQVLLNRMQVNEYTKQ